MKLVVDSVELVVDLVEVVVDLTELVVDLSELVVDPLELVVDPQELVVDLQKLIVDPAIFWLCLHLTHSWPNQLQCCLVPYHPLPLQTKSSSVLG